jgi:uncharacterized protein (DUF58 family)
MSNTLLDGSDKENIEANESILSPTDSEFPTDFGKVDSFFDPSIRVRLVPTRRLWWAIAAGIPLTGFAATTGQSWFLWFYNGFFLVLAIISSQLGASGKNLRFRRRMDAVLSVRARNRIRVEIENEEDIALHGRIRDEIPSSFAAEGNEAPFHVNPGRAFSFDYFLMPPERGEYSFRATFLRIQCPLGLVERQLELNTEQPVKVYPNLLALREFQLLNQQGRLREAGIRKSRMRGAGTEFESLRDYAQGDDFRKIDWKATARRGKPIVREYEVEKNQAVVLCIDCGRHMMSEINGVRKLDLVLDAVLMLIQSALSAGDNVGLLAYGTDVIRYIPPKKGHRQLGILLNAMFNLVAEPIESDSVRAFAYLSSRHKRRSLIVNFTAVEDLDRAKEVLTSFGNLSKGNISLLGNIADPRFRELLKQVPDTEEKLFSYASAHYLTDERRQATSLLKSAGMNVLDSEPQDLATDLVNFYLYVKSRGKL